MTVDINLADLSRFDQITLDVMGIEDVQAPKLIRLELESPFIFPEFQSGKDSDPLSFICKLK
jgi:hypothetical protein